MDGKKKSRRLRADLKFIEKTGISKSKARRQLVTRILYDYFSDKLGRVFCFRCACSIDKEEEFHLDHIDGYLDSDDPLQKYLDIDNIAASHPYCNIAAGQRLTDEKKDS